MKPIALVVALGFFIAATNVAWAAISDTVKTDEGLISGIAGASPEVRIYKGIPYAAPPVGNLRWRPPQPAAHWDGVRKAEQSCSITYTTSTLLCELLPSY